MFGFLIVACVEAGGGSGVDTAAAPVDTGAGDSAAGDTADSAGDTAAPAPPAACTAWGSPVQTGAVADPTLEEISGVAPSVQNPGALWVVEDHGNEPAVYAIDETGALLATVHLGGVEDVDMEDLDLAPCPEGTCIVVADTGNNQHDRTDLALVVVPEPLLDGHTQFTEPAVRYGFTWPEPEDNEAITHTDDGRFVLASKRTDKTTQIATVPAYTDGVEATIVASLATAKEADAVGGGLVTSLSMWPDQHALLVRTYQYSHNFALPDGLDSVASAPLTELPTPVLPHDEAVGFDAVRRGYWTIPEAPLDGPSPVWWVPCVDSGG